MIKLGSNNIGKIYLGSNPIGKVYLGRNLVFQSGSSPTPPTPPTPGDGIPYIRGGAGSYIDTGITADNTTRVVLWARNINPTVGNSIPFGSQVSADSSAFVFYTAGTTRIGSIGVRYRNSGTTYVSNAWKYLSHYHKYELGPDGFLVDDTQLATVSASSFSNGLNIHLFGNNTNGTHSPSNGIIDICACKIYKNDVLVRDYTATNSPSVGLYDAVSGTLFTNAGSGSFTYGTFDENAYTPLEYVSSSGSSYFDTDIKGDYDLRCVLAFKPTGTTAQFYRVIGARDTSPTNMFEVATGNDSYINARLYLNYGTSATTAYSSTTNNYLTGRLLTVIKNNNVVTAYSNNSTFGSATTGPSDTSFTTTNGIRVFGSRGTNQHFVGDIYYNLLGACCFVPASVGGVAGMYDTYNDVFHPSETETPFIAGPTI